MKIYNQILCTATLICCLSACSTDSIYFNPTGGNSTPRALVVVDRHLDLIVADLITAMVQVQELVPLTTTLQVSEPRGRYGEKLVAALEAAGYGMQWVTADQGDYYLSYENRIIRSDTRDARDFVVSAGDIKLRREYKVSGNTVIPSSIMYISGSRDFSPVVLNDNIFLQQGGAMTFVSGSEFELQDSSRQSTPMRDVEQDASVAASGSRNENVVQAALSESLNDESSSLLARIDEFRPLRRTKFTFNNDALILGRQNKALVKLFLEEYDVTEDALFLSTCATGDESQEHADEHVTRLKEEFLFNNIPSARIVEQGCAPGEYPSGEEIEEHTVMLVQRRLVGDVQSTTTPATQSYPNRPLALTIPHNIGGTTDYQARIVTMMAGERDILGQSIQTINKPGEGGRTGWSWFAETAGRAGYDISTYSVPNLLAQSLKFSTQYNIDTMEPIANWGADPVVLAVPSASQFRTLRQFLKFARKNPGKVSVSGGGMYVGHHIALLQLEQAAKVSLVYQAADDADAAMQQIETGDVMAGLNDMSGALRQGDKIRILAIANEKRHPTLPSVPTFVELGVKVNSSSANYRGLMVPKGTPDHIIETLSEAAVRMFNHPVVAQRMEEAGVPLKILNRDETQALWSEQQRYLAEFLKGLN